MWTPDMPIVGQPGLSKREYYAAIANAHLSETWQGDQADFAARFAVQAADALILALTVRRPMGDAPDGPPDNENGCWDCNGTGRCNKCDGKGVRKSTDIH
jgi:hypothetical protein